MKLRRAIAAMVLACGIGLTEAALRWGVGFGDPPLVVRDDEIEYQLIPSQSYRRFGNNIVINSMGLRGAEVSTVRAADERRIMLIGDSVVYGNHNLDQADTIASAMTRFMQSGSTLRRCRISVLPVAVSSWGPVNQAAFLKRLDAGQVDSAVLILSSHDLYDTPDFLENLIPYRLKPSRTAIGDASKIIWEWLTSRAPPPNPKPIEQREAESLRAMDSIADMLRKAGTPLHLVFHPTVRERGLTTSYERDRFKRWAKDQAVSFENLAALPISSESYRDDIHPNASGAAQIARWLSGIVLSDLPSCS